MLLQTEPTNFVFSGGYTKDSCVEVGVCPKSRTVEEPGVYHIGIFVGGGSGELDFVDVEVPMVVDGKGIGVRRSP